MSRRQLLARGALAGTGVALAAGTGLGIDAQAASAASPATDPAAWRAPRFAGAHQGGILGDGAPQGSMTAFDVVVGSPSELRDLLQAITARCRELTSGGPTPAASAVSPPADNGILGPVVPGGALGVTLGMGSSLFAAGRFGLEGRRPAGLTEMPVFPNDDIDPTRAHGDLNLLLQATDPDTTTHALRDILKHTSGAMQPRWRLDGTRSPARPSGTPRNSMGFKDGIANPDVSTPAGADRYLWTTDGTGPTAWTVGGTYQVVRAIRMLVEFWDRVSLTEQQTMIGRDKAVGAPLGQTAETDVPDYAADPQGLVIPLDAHIRMANPRTAATDASRILRRSFNYDRGLDVNGNQDQGLLFLAYQQDIERQFAAVQRRLIDEPLVDYISPVGGGYFFVPPGVVDDDDYLGRGLFT